MYKESEMVTKPQYWVSEYGDYLYSFAYFRVSDKVVAEDLVQETFLAALESFENFKNNSSIKTWLTSILKNKIFDFYKKEKRTVSISQLELENEDENIFIDKYFQNANDGYPHHWKRSNSPKSWESSPLEAFVQEEFLEILNNCLDKLPSKQARIFILREIDGYSTQDICKELDITESNIWVILHRVRTSLRNCLEINWFESKTSKE